MRIYGIKILHRLLLHILHHLRHGRTNHGVLIGEVKYLHHVFSISVWIIATCFGTHIIDRTIIVITEKCTWRFIQNPITVFIHVKILNGEIRNTHAKMFGNSLNIYIAKNG